MTRLLGWLAAAGVSAGLFLGLGYAPREITQGNVQRIMYLHVPSVLTAYLAFAVVFLASLAFLFSRWKGWDRLAWASAELGVLFTALTLVSGAIWGKPTWGTWWTWDARLTTTAVLFVIYVGYLLLRRMVEDQDRGARYAAVLGIIGFLDIPVVHFSVKWWRTLHQPSTLLGPETFPISPPLLAALLVNVVAFLLLYAYFLARRLALLSLEEEAQA